jgi:hypothetical protein
LKNRADNVSVEIPNWSAYNADGTVKADLGQTPADGDLDTQKAWRHVNTLIQLRTALEDVLGLYYDGSSNPWTLASLLTAAVGRSDYNRTSPQLQVVGYFDGEDVEEILKAIDLLGYGQTTADAKVVFMEYTNYGGATLAQIGSGPGGIVIESLIRFAGTAPTNPKLRVYGYCDGTSLIRIHANTERWNEHELNWFNKPTYGPQIASVTWGQNLGWYEVALPSGQYPHGLTLRCSGDIFPFYFYTKEHADTEHHPQFVEA